MTKWLDRSAGKAYRRLNNYTQVPKVMDLLLPASLLAQGSVKGRMISPLQNRWGPSFVIVIVSRDSLSHSLETWILTTPFFIVELLRLGEIWAFFGVRCLILRQFVLG